MPVTAHDTEVILWVEDLIRKIETLPVEPKDRHTLLAFAWGKIAEAMQKVEDQLYHQV